MIAVSAQTVTIVPASIIAVAPRPAPQGPDSRLSWRARISRAAKPIMHMASRPVSNDDPAANTAFSTRPIISNCTIIRTAEINS